MGYSENILCSKSVSVIDPSIKGPKFAARRCPRTRLSRTIGTYPLLARSLDVCEPMYPAPPTINTFFKTGPPLEFVSLHSVAKTGHTFLWLVIAQSHSQGLSGPDKHNQFLCPGYPRIYEVSLEQNEVLGHHGQYHGSIL